MFAKSKKQNSCRQDTSNEYTLYPRHYILVYNYKTSTDYILDTRVWYPPYKKDVLCLISNCIRWWGSNSGDLGCVEYPFIAITPNSSQTKSWLIWLFGFYGISTFLGYLMPNPLYTYILNIYDLVWLGFMAYQPL